MPHACAQCGGQGVVSDNQGLFSFSAALPRPAVAGASPSTTIPTCQRHRRKDSGAQGPARVPAGVDQRPGIRLKGRGGPGRDGGPPQQPLRRHPGWRPTRSFGRERAQPDASRCRSPTPRPSWATTITVPTLDGEGDAQGCRRARSRARSLRVRGRGVPGGSGRNGRKPGDLLVTVELVGTDRARATSRTAAVESLAEVDRAGRRVIAVGGMT